MIDKFHLKNPGYSSQREAKWEVMNIFYPG